MDLWLPLAALGGIVGVYLILIALGKPRLLTYAIFALSPTQYIFVPVTDFFISPADVLVSAAALGLMFRLASLERPSLRSARQHLFIILMVLSYCVGFVVLGVFSRTLIRVVLGIVPSLLACELLHTRRHVIRAATAVVIAGAIDAGYGLFFVVRGTPLHPTRFSGMSDVNFSAMLIIAAAVIALAQRATVRKAGPLFIPGALGGFGLATLSQAGLVALGAAWITFLRRVLTRSNKIRLAVGVAMIVVAALSFTAVRERILTRNAREVHVDGVARNSWDVRWEILEIAGRGFSESPFLGLGYFKFVDYSTRDPQIDAATVGQGYQTHNSYLEVLVEGGLVAFCLFLLHWWQYARGARLALRAAIYKRDSVVAACLGAFVVVLVCAAFANVLMIYSFWAICGLARACMNLLEREHTNQVRAHGAAAL